MFLRFHFSHLHLDRLWSPVSQSAILNRLILRFKTRRDKNITSHGIDPSTGCATLSDVCQTQIVNSLKLAQMYLLFLLTDFDAESIRRETLSRRILVLRTQSLMYKLGVKIRTLRKMAGLTQEQLAEAANVSTNFIGYVERGQRALSIKTLERIAKALNVTPKDMFEFTEHDDLDEDDRHTMRYVELLQELRKCTEDDLHVLGILAQRLSARSSVKRSRRPIEQMGEETGGN